MWIHLLICDLDIQVCVMYINCIPINLFKRKEVKTWRHISITFLTEATIRIEKTSNAIFDNINKDSLAFLDSPQTWDHSMFSKFILKNILADGKCVWMV